jgi:hypothetical protein
MIWVIVFAWPTRGARARRHRVPTSRAMIESRWRADFTTTSRKGRCLWGADDPGRGLDGPSESPSRNLTVNPFCPSSSDALVRNLRPRHRSDGQHSAAIRTAANSPFTPLRCKPQSPGLVCLILHPLVRARSSGIPVAAYVFSVFWGFVSLPCMHAEHTMGRGWCEEGPMSRDRCGSVPFRSETKATAPRSAGRELKEDCKITVFV